MTDTFLDSKDRWDRRDRRQMSILPVSSEELKTLLQIETKSEPDLEPEP
jgi:hypothetical protein